jgi:subtilisin family serine protease
VPPTAEAAHPDDPHFPQQWGLRAINAPEAWSISAGEGIVVAVIDSGVTLDHPDLEGAWLRSSDGRVIGRDLVDGEGDPIDEHGHGTMVAGIIGARTGNGAGVASVAPRSRLMPIRVLDADAAGRSRDVDAAIRWAVRNGADVINLSLEVAREEEPGSDEPWAPVDAVRFAWDSGVVVVAAAGNDANDLTDFPEDSPVVLVGATDEEDERAPFSESGRVDALMAPGVEIVSTWCRPCGEGAQHSIGLSDGTSYAAAHVSGAIALLLAAGVDPDDAVRHLRETAVDLGPPGPDPTYGHGRIDVSAALEAAVGSRPDRPRSRAASERRPEPAPTAPEAATRGAEAPRGLIVLAAVAIALLLVDVAALAWWRRRSGA